MDRGNHYEAAFEAYLQWHRLCYVAVDESRRAMLDDISIKSLDFIVFGGDGARLVVDVKGRRFPLGKPDRPRRVWECWSTRDDVDGLEALGGTVRPRLCRPLGFHVSRTAQCGTAGGRGRPLDLARQALLAASGAVSRLSAIYASAQSQMGYRDAAARRVPLASAAVAPLHALRYDRRRGTSGINYMNRLKIAVRLESLGLPLRRALFEAGRMGVAGIQVDAVGDLSPNQLSETGRREFRNILRTTIWN